MSELLLVSDEGRLRRLTLNRPEKRNALNVELCGALVAALAEAGTDPAVGAILLDANGPHFCAGMDLGEALETGAEETLRLHQDLFSAGTRLRKPMVAAVQGAALAGGLGLALDAHVVVAASDARFGLTETRIGLWPYVIFRVVAEAAGVRKATELALTGRTIETEEALRIGLVDIVAGPEQLAQSAREVAMKLAEGGASVVTRGLAFVDEMRGLDRVSAMNLAAGFRRRAFESPDFREGVAAFREKRRPNWPPHGGGG